MFGKKEKMPLEKAREITTEFSFFNDLSTKKISDEVKNLGPEKAMEVAEAFTVIGDFEIKAFKDDLKELLEKHPQISLYGIMASENPIGTGIRTVRKERSAGNALNYKVAAELQVLADRLMEKNTGSGISALMDLIR